MQATSSNILVVIPTYNEADNLPLLTASVFQALPECAILVVDDASPDGTGDWCEAQNHRQLHLLAQQGKSGIGSALLAGLRYAKQHDYRLVVTMDADFSHQPTELPQLIASIDDRTVGRRSDVTIGSRYMVGGSIEGWGWRRRIMSRLVNWFARCFLGLGVHDCSTGFRCYRVAALAEVLDEQFLARGYAFEEEILYRLQRRGARLEEIPSRFSDRDRGGSKLNITEAVKAGWVLIRLSLSRLWPCSTC